MASPAMARANEEPNGGMFRIRRETLLFVLGALVQLLIAVFVYGQLTATVRLQGEQLNRIELRLNEITGHK